MVLTRRNALRGLFLAAPAIVAAPSLMRVSAAALESLLPASIVTATYPGGISFSELITAALRARSHQLSENVMANNALLRALRENRIDPVSNYRIASNA